MSKTVLVESDMSKTVLVESEENHSDLRASTMYTDLSYDLRYKKYIPVTSEVTKNRHLEF